MAPAFGEYAFYTPPLTLPETAGSVVRVENLLVAGAAAGRVGVARRLMYVTVDSAGEKVAVTGTYIEPHSPWTAPGPRPLVSYAEGTRGQGDQCAPSVDLAATLSGAARADSYDASVITGFLSRGFAVVVTDYIGLGTTDRVHTYENRVDQGHAVLDAARAAINTQGSSVTPLSPVGGFGYSQGGGAIAAAAELAPSYAPQLKFTAAYVGAPPAELDQVLGAVDGSSQTEAIAYAINGLLQSYPQLQPTIGAALSTLGQAELTTAAARCINDTGAPTSTQAWTANGVKISQTLADNPAVRDVLDAQTLGRNAPRAAIRIVTGTRDDIVPHPQAKRLAQNWCDRGANITYVPVPQWFNSGGSGLNHLLPMLAQTTPSQRWLADRLTGTPNTPNCSSLPTLP